MIDTNSSAIVADRPANSLTLTPPRNSRPIATTAITMNAPRSGSSSSRPPTRPTANAIGANPLENWCMRSCLRTAKSAAYRITNSFISSDGCRLIMPSEIQRRAPSTTLPMPGISTATSSSSPSTNSHGAAFCQRWIGIANAKVAAARPIISTKAWRVRWCVVRSVAKRAESGSAIDAE